MRFRGKLLLCIVLSAVACGAAAQTQDAGGASKAEVQGLLDALGGTRGFGAIDQRKAELYSRNHPCVPTGAVQQALSSPQIQQQQIDAQIAIIQRHFTSDDIRRLTRFFRSPVGQKWLQEMPKVAREGMQTGRQMDERHINSMVAALQKQGVLDSKGQCPAAGK
jgi:uncharacterized protein